MTDDAGEGSQAEVQGRESKKEGPTRGGGRLGARPSPGTCTSTCSVRRESDVEVGRERVCSRSCAQGAAL